MSRECDISFADLFRRANGREWTAAEERELLAMDQDARNAWVRELAETAGDVATEDRRGTDGRVYTAFWFQGPWIRPVTEADAPAIVRLLTDVAAAGLTAMPGPFTEADQIAFLRGLPERAVYHAALDGETGQLLGIQDVLPAADPEQDVGEVSTFVEAAARGRGIGRLLCGATFGRASASGFRRLRAIIPVGNVGAIAFYRAMGFRAVTGSETVGGDGDVVRAELELP